MVRIDQETIRNTNTHSQIHAHSKSERSCSDEYGLKAAQSLEEGCQAIVQCGCYNVDVASGESPHRFRISAEFTLGERKRERRLIKNYSTKG